MNSDPIVGCNVEIERTVVSLQYQRSTGDGRANRYTIMVSDAIHLKSHVCFTESRCEYGDKKHFYTWTQHFKEVVFCRV